MCLIEARTPLEARMSRDKTAAAGSPVTIIGLSLFQSL